MKKYLKPMNEHGNILQRKVCLLQPSKEFQGTNHCAPTESQVPIKTLRFKQINSKVICECLNKLDTHGLYNKVWMLWVPGHIGTQGNETTGPKKELTVPFRAEASDATTPLSWEPRDIHSFIQDPLEDGSGQLKKKLSPTSFGLCFE